MVARGRRALRTWRRCHGDLREGIVNNCIVTRQVAVSLLLLNIAGCVVHIGGSSPDPLGSGVISYDAGTTTYDTGGRAVPGVCNPACAQNQRCLNRSGVSSCVANSCSDHSECPLSCCLCDRLSSMHCGSSVADCEAATGACTPACGSSRLCVDVNGAPMCLQTCVTDSDCPASGCCLHHPKPDS